MEYKKHSRRLPSTYIENITTGKSEEDIMTLS